MDQKMNAHIYQICKIFFQINYNIIFKDLNVINL